MAGDQGLGVLAIDREYPVILRGIVLRGDRSVARTRVDIEGIAILPARCRPYAGNCQSDHLDAIVRLHCLRARWPAAKGHKQALAGRAADLSHGYLPNTT